MHILWEIFFKYISAVFMCVYNVISTPKFKNPRFLSRLRQISAKLLRFVLRNSRLSRFSSCNAPITYSATAWHQWKHHAHRRNLIMLSSLSPLAPPPALVLRRLLQPCPCVDGSHWACVREKKQKKTSVITLKQKNCLNKVYLKSHGLCRETKFTATPPPV